MTFLSLKEFGLERDPSPINLGDGIDADFLRALLSYPLPFDRSIARDSIIIIKSSQSGCSGEFDESAAIETIKAIHKKMALFSLAPEIRLDETRLARPSILFGGTCSAMSLLVASKFLEIQQLMLSSFTGLEERMIAVIETYAISSSLHYRSIQAAFNTITVSGTQEVSPGEKIKLIATYFNIRGIDQSLIFESSRDDPSSNKNVEAFIESDGVYVVRAIKDADPSKEEEVVKQESKGHTTVLFKQTIREESRFYFYDPNDGIKIIDATKDLGKQIYNLQTKISTEMHLRTFQIVKFI